MKIFSLSHIIELSTQLPDPRSAPHPVVRLPLKDWDAVRDADHPGRQFDQHENPWVEFERINWKNSRGEDSPRWVVRGLVAL